MYRYTHLKILVTVIAVGDDVVETLESKPYLVLLIYAHLIASTLWYVAELVTMLFNRKRRAVHDFIAGTVVVRTAAMEEPIGMRRILTSVR